MKSKQFIALGATVALVAYALVLSLVGAQVQTSKTLSNTGTVTAVGVGIYQYQNCTSPVTSISWGTINPGASVNDTVYIRNQGDTPATLSMTTSNWSPSNASSYITLNWNYGGQTLSVNQVIQVKFTLAISSSISGITSFSFTITIVATG